MTTTAIPAGRNPTPSSDADERTAYVALALTDQIGGRRLAALLSAFGSASNVLHVARHPPVTRDAALASALRHARAASPADAQATVIQCERSGIALLIPGDAAYPPALRSIPDPPAMLFARGDVSLASRPAIAVIGSRDHSRYGREVAALISSAAADAGLVVVSGMARGLDAVAHSSTLDREGLTIGVLGNGIGVVYPAANAALYARVEQRGLLLTEHPPGERPLPGSFPRRNRLISGLANVIVVVEAAEGSGTLVTVSCALEQGREVMAVPGPITSPTSVGTNRLIRDGAEPLLAADDLLAKFAMQTVARPIPQGEEPVCTLSGEEALVFNVTNHEPRLVDDIAQATGLPMGILLGLLCGLELGGLVEQLPGGWFRRAARR
ncbi:MAG TPA: DNA-processing protein DprA [Gemmatimonadales bacterium]